MKCDESKSLMAACAVGALPDEERQEVESQIRQCCADCERELDELLAASTLLAADVAPVQPSSDLKRQLFERINCSQAKPIPSLVSEQQDSQQSWSRLQYLFYLAAMIGCVLTGAWFARSGFVGEPNQQQLANSSSAQDQWQQRIESAVEKFGDSRLHLANFESESKDDSLFIELNFDTIANQLHILVSGVPEPKTGEYLYIWLHDDKGESLLHTQLNYAGIQKAFGVSNVHSSETTALASISRVFISVEAAADVSTPSAHIVGIARVKTE